MADVSDLRAAVLDRGREINDAAITQLLVALDAVVPDSGISHGGKLRDARVVGTVERGGRFATTVSYNTTDPDTAMLTEQGTSEHPISAPAALGGPLSFYWPKVGHRVWFREVMWKPGPGVAKNIGWFSRTMARWPEFLDDAAAGLR